MEDETDDSGFECVTLTYGLSDTIRTEIGSVRYSRSTEGGMRQTLDQKDYVNKRRVLVDQVDNLHPTPLGGP